MRDRPAADSSLCLQIYNSENSLEAYKKVSEQSYDSIFGFKKCTRYIDTYITSVRAKEDGVMKVRRMNIDAKLAFKAFSSDEIITHIKSEMKQKDEQAHKLDAGLITNQKTY